MRCSFHNFFLCCFFLVYKPSIGALSHCIALPSRCRCLDFTNSLSLYRLYHFAASADHLALTASLLLSRSRCLGLPFRSRCMASTNSLSLPRFCYFVAVSPLLLTLSASPLPSRSISSRSRCLTFTDCSCYYDAMMAPVSAC